MFFTCDQAMAQLVHKIVILALAALRAGFCAPLASLPGFPAARCACCALGAVLARPSRLAPSCRLGVCEGKERRLFF